MCYLLCTRHLASGEDSCPLTDALHIASSSGANLSGAVSAPDTGGWQTYATATVSVALPAGKQTLTTDQDNGGWNIHDLTFS